MVESSGSGHPDCEKLAVVVGILGWVMNCLHFCSYFGGMPGLINICPIPDDHIAPSRSALFLAWSVLRGIRNGGYDANQAA